MLGEDKGEQFPACPLAEVHAPATERAAISPPSPHQGSAGGHWVLGFSGVAHSSGSWGRSPST